ncbi:MAG: NAD-dependent epimerase/dehydratase family protein [Candidatus Bathyarchaeia archaeon]
MNLRNKTAYIPLLEGSPISKKVTKKILITGSSGFIGSYLRRALPESDGFDQTPSQTTNIVGDLLDLPVSVDQYDVIYHLASVVGTTVSKQNPIATYKVNVCGTLNLLRSFKGLFIFLSTVGVYDPLKNPYFLSKYVCEEIVRNAPCDHIIFRLANPYGRGSKSVIQKWLETDHIQIYGDGNQKRDFVYIEDVVEILANPQKLKINKTYNVGSGVPITLNELSKLIVKLTGEKTVEYLPAREFEIYEPVIKPDIICKTPLEEGLKKCIEERKKAT